MRKMMLQASKEGGGCMSVDVFLSEPKVFHPALTNPANFVGKGQTLSELTFGRGSKVIFEQTMFTKHINT